MDRIRKKLDVGLDEVQKSEPEGPVTPPDGKAAAELAPAKVNLALHVTGRRADGYHLLDSLVVFPRVGDLLEAEPADGLSLTIDGPFARDLGAGADNLVLRAALLLRGEAPLGAAFRLVKSLPGGERYRRRFRRRRRGAPPALAAVGAADPAYRDPRAPRCRRAGLRGRAGGADARGSARRSTRWRSRPSGSCW